MLVFAVANQDKSGLQGSLEIGWLDVAAGCLALPCRGWLGMNIIENGSRLQDIFRQRNRNARCPGKGGKPSLRAKPPFQTTIPAMAILAES